MKRLFAVLLILAAAVPGARAGKLVIKGSNTFGEELGPHLLAAFRAGRAELDVELGKQGSGSGILALLAGECDIAASSRAMSEDELRLARSRGLVLRNHTIGYYGVAVVVHASNPVQALTDKQVRDIFTGQITRWSEVGGGDAPIHALIRDPASGTHLGFQELAMERRPYAPQARALTNYADIARAVLADPHAIGYTGVPLVTDPGLRILRINGVAPDSESVAAERYPYARQLRLYTDRKKTSKEARDFIRFVQSAPGQALLGELGFVRRAQLKLPLHDDTP